MLLLLPSCINATVSGRTLQKCNGSASLPLGQPHSKALTQQDLGHFARESPCPKSWPVRRFMRFNQGTVVSRIEVENVSNRMTLLLFLLLSFASWLPAQDPEFRAAWVTRFEWPASGETATKNSITSIMESLAEHNFNAVLFQVRGAAETLYPSPYEPWASQFDYTDPGWDPMAYAIQEAHANGLEFHAYINTHTMSAATPPSTTSPQHLYNIHGPDASESWVIHDADGNPVSSTDSYTWLSPGIPDASAWTRRAIMHIVDNYDIDGIHFDRIRTPGAQYSHDPITEARFAGPGNPDNESWGEFMRSQITRDLRRIYGATMLRKPEVKISAAPFGICRRVPGGYQGTGTESYYSWYQDSFGWMENHVLDCIFPMIYWEIGSAHPFEVLLADFLDRDGGRHIYAGAHGNNDAIAQIQEARSQGGLGTTIFAYSYLDLPEYSSTVYTESVETPEMPWKTNPTTAITVGTITDLNGDPVVDARVNITGDSYNYLSSGDGFYSILDIDPGTYTISAQKDGVGSVEDTVTVAAGDVIEVDLQLSTSAGQLSLDKDKYLSSEMVTVTLTDSDLAGDSSVDVQATSLREATSETLTLSAQGNGSFQGTIQLEDAAPSSDGKLQVNRGGSMTITYQDAFDGTGPATTTAEAEVDVYVVIYDEPLDSDPSWQAEGDWAFGVPQGNAGSHGGPDPTSGYTGDNVYGYNLDGGYTNEMAATEWLISPAIDASQGSQTRLEFRRWLQVEQNAYDRAFIQVSADGQNWSTVWANPDSTITDSDWQLVEYDISGVADRRQAVAIRWGLGPTDVGWTYAGWNIDDVRVLQIPGMFDELIIDNDEPGFDYTGTWETSTFGDNYGDDKRYAEPGDGSSMASWTFDAIPTGRYRLDFWVNDSDYAADAHYYIKHDNAPAPGEEILASQNNAGGGWHQLGTYPFSSGTAEVMLSDEWTGTGDFVIADAMKLTPIEVFQTDPVNIWMLR